MRVYERVAEAITTDVDGIAQAQAVAGAGNLTLNGVAVVAENGNAPYGIGSAVLDPPRQVTITSAGNDTGITFTVYGYDRSGKFFSEVVTGANAGAAQSLSIFAAVTRIAASGAAAGNVSAGWNNISRSPWMILGNNANGGFRLLTIGNDNEGADIFLETTSKNILRDGAMSGDYPGANEVQVIDDAGVPFNTDIESVCLVPYAGVRVVATGNSTPITLRANPNHTT